ncbi:TetR/AcrR family transcriptional regulator [Desulfomicrobium orale]|uniref:HTH tetR-type domain-containing protein n=1 Tax=Desulfomicrobium orale DSM 12838 TaxID=888061 RepID=A0A0X8JQP6_9BACT|nr:TetR/AcrR family transcriptional regulator [Desulfomicrobium orale]AMD93209.1 hypothetical protein AXF15_08915 [Desulfomicrobium orale DSM 12838]
MSRSLMKREVIEEAAIRLFSTKGLTRTTVKDIAAAAGVTEGVLYRHYEGKEEMAWKLFNRELDQFIHLVSEVLFDNRLPFAQRFSLAIQTIYDYYVYNSDQFAFILLTQHGFPEERLVSRKSDPMDVTSRFIGQGIGDGDIPPCDAELCAGLIMGAILQPLVLHRYGRLELEPSTHLHVTEACMRILGAA